MLPVTQMLYIKSIACSLWNIDIKLIILSVFFSAYMNFNMKNEATKLMHKRHNLFVNYSLNCTGLGTDRQAASARFTRLNFCCKVGAYTI